MKWKVFCTQLFWFMDIWTIVTQPNVMPILIRFKIRAFNLNIIIDILSKWALNCSICTKVEITEPFDYCIVQLILLKQRLSYWKLVIVIQYKLLYFIRSQPNSFVEVDLYENSHVTRYFGYLNKSWFCCQR